MSEFEILENHLSNVSIILESSDHSIGILMKSWVFLLSVIPLTVAFAQESSWDKCPPSIKGKDLVKWRKDLAAEIIKGNSKAVLDKISYCFPAAEPACFGDLSYYAKMKSNPNVYYDRSYTYLAPEKELTLKSPKDLPKEFVNSEGNIQIPKDILELAKKNGWKTLQYKTRSTGGFDTPPNLFLLVISTPEKEIVIQTSPKPDKNSLKENVAADPVPHPQNKDFTSAQDVLTIITMDKTKKPPVGQLRLLKSITDSNDYTKGFLGIKIGSTKAHKAYEWNNELRSNDCIQCHTTPFKAVSPRGYKTVNSEKRMSPEHEKQVDEINKILQQYSTWGTKTIDGTEIRLGPAIDSFPLGWAPTGSETRTEDFLKYCIKRSPEYVTHKGFNSYTSTITKSANPKINYEKLARAMNCVECHNNSIRGALHENLDMAEIKFRIAGDRSMPHNIELNDDERIALITCLTLERSELQDKWRQSGEWMQKESCFGDQFKGNPPKIIGPATPDIPISGSTPAVNKQ